jgi:hypothetical protein
MADWILPLVSMVIGLVSGLFGAYVGIKVGLTKLEIHVSDNRTDIEKLQKESVKYNEDILIHDLELEDVMRNLDIKRKRRQNWRFGIYDR